jgi:hypothetical protein
MFVVGYSHFHKYGFNPVDYIVYRGCHSVMLNGKKIILIHFLLGFEISDVLKIDDKDYAITFSLYFR